MAIAPNKATEHASSLFAMEECCSISPLETGPRLVIEFHQAFAKGKVPFLAVSVLPSLISTI